LEYADAPRRRQARWEGVGSCQSTVSSSQSAEGNPQPIVRRAARKPKIGDLSPTVNC
jgi:hypothetical protein